MLNFSVETGSAQSVFWVKTALPLFLIVYQGSFIQSSVTNQEKKYFWSFWYQKYTSIAQRNTVMKILPKSRFQLLSCFCSYFKLLFCSIVNCYFVFDRIFNTPSTSPNAQHNCLFVDIADNSCQFFKTLFTLNMCSIGTFAHNLKNPHLYENIYPVFWRVCIM